MVPAVGLVYAGTASTHKVLIEFWNDVRISTAIVKGSVGSQILTVVKLTCLFDLETRSSFNYSRLKKCSDHNGDYLPN